MQGFIFYPSLKMTTKI
nr:unnamed protein product [Callosobruchus chinensis]